MVENTVNGKQGGLLKGNRHSEGGIKAIIDGTNQKIELEGGENVLTRGVNEIDEVVTVTGTPCEIASEINQMGGGVAIPCDNSSEGKEKFMYGGSVDFFGQSFSDEGYSFKKNINNIFEQLIKSNNVVEVSLSNLINHNELFKNYYKLKYVMVIFKPMSEEDYKEDVFVNGYTNLPKNKEDYYLSEITIKLKTKYYEQYGKQQFGLESRFPEYSIEGQLLHEIQHICQCKDGKIIKGRDTCIEEAKRGMGRGKSEQEIEVIGHQEYKDQLGEQEAMVTVKKWLATKGLLYGDTKWFSDENFNKFEDGGIINRSFIGEFGGGNVEQNDSLEEAKKLASIGLDNEEVRLLTGWYIAKDGKWRFEISDTEMEVNFDFEKAIEQTKANGGRKISEKIGNVISHENLFKAYPSFKDIDFVYFYDKNSKIEYISFTDKNIISFNLYHYEQQTGGTRTNLLGGGVDRGGLGTSGTALNTEQNDNGRVERGYENSGGYSKEDAKYPRRIFVHELQHFIQRREGFVSGSKIDRELRGIIEEKGFDESRLTISEKKFSMELARQRYQDKLGEVEATDVDRRIDFTDKQREKNKPDNMFEQGGIISDFEMPDAEVLRYGKKLKKDHPEIWDAGGNIRGNESFENLVRISERGYWLKDEQEFYNRWQSFKARHQHNHRLAGIVANIKWASWGNIGKEGAKEVVEGNRKFEDGVTDINNVKSFYDWYIEWYKGVSDKMNIFFSLPNILSPFKEKDVIILDLFEKIDQSVDAKQYLEIICKKADKYKVTIYLEPTKDYLVNYYSNFGFELTSDNQFMKRLPKFEDGGLVPSSMDSFRNMCNQMAMDKHNAVINWERTMILNDKQTGEEKSAVGRFFDDREFEVDTINLDMVVVDRFEKGGKVDKPEGILKGDFHKCVLSIVNEINSINEVKDSYIDSENKKYIIELELPVSITIQQIKSIKERLTLCENYFGEYRLRNNIIIFELIEKFKDGGLIKPNRIFVKADEEISGSFISPDGISKIELSTLKFKENAYEWILNANKYDKINITELIESEIFDIYDKSKEILVYIVSHENNPTLDAGYYKEHNIIVINNASNNFKNLKNGKEITYRTNERGENNGIVRKSESGRVAYMLWLRGLISHELQHFVQREEVRLPSKIYNPEQVEYDFIFSEIEARESQLRESNRSGKPFEGLNTEGLIFKKGGKVDKYEIGGKIEGYSLDLETEKLQSLNNEYEDFLNKERELTKVGRTQEQYLEQKNVTKKAREISRQLVHQNNIVHALNGGGSITEIIDQSKKVYKCADLRAIPTEYYAFEEDTVLISPKPAYIPTLGKEELRSRGYVFDSVRVEEDSYVIAVNGFSYKKEPSKYQLSQEVEDIENFYSLVTLEQLVLTSQYYHTYAKALEIKKSEEANKRGEDVFRKMPDRNKLYYYEQKNFYLGMPSKIQKKYTKEEWDSFTLEEKQDIYIPVKKYGVKRIESKLASNSMYTSLHKMYETFVDSTATMPKERVANPKVWLYWATFREMMNWKVNDLQVRKESDSESRKVALETSFGDSNINTSLKDSLGILVKRQNGSDIKSEDIEQIKSKWNSINSTLGILNKPAYEFGLKISHTGDTRVYASKAVGMFIPDSKAIAVSNKFGDSMFGYIMAHELAHFLDFQIGKKYSRNYASDNYESKAGILANILKINYNKKSDSKYTNSTKECFARAIEQYFAISSFGDGAFHEYNEGKLYFEADDYVNKNVYYEKLKPAIEDFLSDNKWFFGELIMANENKENNSEVEKEASEHIESFNKIQEGEIPIFDFMKSNPKGQAIAIKVLNKLVRADGVVVPIYKWIEGFEKGLLAETSKIESRKSEKGYVEKPTIGDHIVFNKAEQDYYVYLENGGEAYTDFLKKKNDYDSVIDKKENEERDIRNTEREDKQKEAYSKYELVKQNEIKSYIEHGIEPTLNKRLNFYQNEIEQLKNKRSSDTVKDEIRYNERMIEQTKEQVQNSYKIATELYVIINGEVAKKYDWKVGDKVVYDGRIETVIEQITVNHLSISKDVAYKVEKREGIHNQYISYDGLFPVSQQTPVTQPIAEQGEEKEGGIKLENKMETESYSDCLTRNGINLEAENHRFEVGTEITSNGTKYLVSKIEGEFVHLTKEKTFSKEQDDVIYTYFTELISSFKEGKIQVKGFEPNELKEFARVLNTIAICYKMEGLEKDSEEMKKLEAKLEVFRKVSELRGLAELEGYQFTDISYNGFVEMRKVFEEDSQKYSLNIKFYLNGKESYIDLMGENKRDTGSTWSIDKSYENNNIYELFEKGHEWMKQLKSYHKFKVGDEVVAIVGNTREKGVITKSMVVGSADENAYEVTGFGDPVLEKYLELADSVDKVDFVPYSEAIKDKDNLQAHSADSIASNTGMRPEAFYNWANKYNVELSSVGHILSNPSNKESVLEDVINDKYERVLGLATMHSKDIEEMIEALEVSLEFSDDSEKEAIENEIEALKISLEFI